MYDGLSNQKKARRGKVDNFPDNPLVVRSSGLLPFGRGDGRPHITEHPIPKLMTEAEDKFRKLLSRQSQTLQDAVREYQRRYERDPPRGFDDWWRFVKDNHVLMIDEYDSINEDMAPFWEMPAEELRRRASLAGHLPSVDIVSVKDGRSTAVNVKDGLVVGSEVSARAKGFLSMLEKFQDKLPDIEFPVNAMAEGRILVPWERRIRSNLTMQSDIDAVHTQFTAMYSPDWRGGRNVWEAYRRTCPPHSSARRLFSSFRASSTNKTSQLSARSEEFVFASDIAGNYSYCQNPWAHYNQGHFFSDWRTIPALFPMFSPAKASKFQDIRIPSHYYYAQTRRYTYGWDSVNLELKEVDHMETPWELKNDKIFWRGASTGGGSSPPGFAAQYQRHRFVRMASDKSSANRTIVFADPPGSKNYVYADVPAASLNDEIMDVAFVNVVDHSNFPGGLEALINAHRFDDGGVNLGDHWKHKYLVDLDGMGYSGRFFSFMESDSAVMKATVYREFFSDWIQPWLHYIPLSQSYSEIYNIHAFFSGATDSTLQAANATVLNLPAGKKHTIDGDRRLRRIARAGKQWKRTIGRRVDMEAYVYRLCLDVHPGGTSSLDKLPDLSGFGWIREQVTRSPLGINRDTSNTPNPRGGCAIAQQKGLRSSGLDCDVQSAPSSAFVQLCSRGMVLTASGLFSKNRARHSMLSSNRPLLRILGLLNQSLPDDPSRRTRCMGVSRRNLPRFFVARRHKTLVGIGRA
ncbi:Beta-1,2-xylosyltransferase 1 [Grifola frondosa]|uniref:Beta-1,2-xylosyltransferase 1 n=1 Tax=Grifola frondosa TaxID=5627 RepID=A0A1C7MH66_GRIFR|nr:Beta-1,2-xylosyltransferase 1 [Grifola frondosa]